MRIAFDTQVFRGAEAFAGLGEAVPLASAQITSEALRDVDALVVRAVTRVDAALLAGTRVRFVGSATAGMDHVDAAALSAMGVAVAHAPGCNADSVSCYVAAALLQLWQRGRIALPRRRLGVIGRGQVGGRVARWALALGLEVRACDPPRQRAGEAGLSTLAQALDCDAVTLHVPLQAAGADRTVNLVAAAGLAAMPAGAWLFHTCRGGVVDEAALRGALLRGHLGGAVVDVWRGEPDHDPALAALCAVATPHVAGHSVDGKGRGTWMVRQALAAWMGVAPPPLPALVPPGPALELPRGLSTWDAAAWALARLYDPGADTQAFRAASAAGRPEAFRRLRQDYPPRRDPAVATVHLGAGDAAHRPALEALGFCCVSRRAPGVSVPRRGTRGSLPTPAPAGSRPPTW